MKDFFYGLLVVIFLLLFYDSSKNPRKFDVSDFNNSVIIDKSDSFMFGKLMYVKYPNDSIIKIKCYGIVYEKYNVGDTINYNLKNN